ncbi:TPA: TIR domain-containing protein, partial [Streptococcus agalactiae]
MAKKKIFISHIGEESEIAKKFKKEILNYTNRGVEIFVSSDDESIYAGDDWEDEVKNNIKSCDMMLVLLSKK